MRQRLPHRLIRLASLVASSFTACRSFDRAAALSFSTILSLVPLLTVIFAILRGFVDHSRIEAIILNQVAGPYTDLADAINRAVNGTKALPLLTIGAASLAFSLISLLISIESVINDLFGTVNSKRNFGRPFKYVLLLSVSPMLILLAVTATSIIQSQRLFKLMVNTYLLGDGIVVMLRLAPYISICLVLVLFYRLIPDRPVRLLHAAAGGIFSGIVWQIAHWCYFRLQYGFSSANIIYGSLAALPVLLVWIYTSWLIIITGAHIVKHLPEVESETGSGTGETD